MKKITDVTAVLLALVFVAAAIPKLAALEFEVEAFERFGLPVWSMYLAGLVELAIGPLLLVRRSSAFGAVIGAGVMTVAIPAVAVGDGVPMAAAPAVFLAACAHVAWHRRRDLAAWIAD